MSRDLQAEVTAFLAEHGPARAKEIAAGIRARLAEVMAVLDQDGFSQAERPAGAHPHSVYWVASRRFPQSRSGLLLSILQDGEWHTRAMIFERAGRSFLTNNAAAELRAAGHVIEYSAKAGYRLVSLEAPEGCPVAGLTSAPSGASSEKCDVVGRSGNLATAVDRPAAEALAAVSGATVRPTRELAVA